MREGAEILTDRRKMRLWCYWTSVGLALEGRRAWMLTAFYDKNKNLE